MTIMKQSDYHNILVIGNGFDVHHKINSKYVDFVEFYLKEENINTIIKEFNNEEHIDEYTEEKTSIKEICQNNMWLQLIRKLKSSYDDRWCSLEELIGDVIIKVNEYDKQQKTGHLSTKDIGDPADIIGSFILIRTMRNRNYIVFEKFAKQLERDLSRLKFLLQKYLIYIYKSSIIAKDNDIQLLFDHGYIDHVLSFNYTSTIKDYYLNDNQSVDVCNVHGDLNDYHNMVFGTNVYIENKEKLYSSFYKKKQTIINKNDNKFLTWSKNDVCEVALFYGFSFGISDTSLIKYLYDKCRIFYICYYDKKAKADILDNLMNIFGREIIENDVDTKRIVFIEKLNDENLVSKLEESAFNVGFNNS